MTGKVGFGNLAAFGESGLFKRLDFLEIGQYLGGNRFIGMLLQFI